MVPLNQNSIHILTDKFLIGLSGRLTAIRQEIAKKHWKSVVLSSHQLKGAAAAYGFKELSALAAQLETLVKMTEGPHETTANKLVGELELLSAQIQNSSKRQIDEEIPKKR